jgi:hypothetical protein
MLPTSSPPCPVVTLRLGSPSSTSNPICQGVSMVLQAPFYAHGFSEA